VPLILTLCSPLTDWLSPNNWPLILRQLVIGFKSILGLADVSASLRRSISEECELLGLKPAPMGADELDLKDLNWLGGYKNQC
jgi:hypothetical protein